MDRPYVGIDFHRRRSVIVRLSAAGEKLWSIRVASDPLAIAEAVPDPEVVVEATYGGMGGRTAPCQRRPCPSGEPAGPLLGQRRVKNDERDAIDLGDMLCLGRPPEAWIAPPATRGAVNPG